MPGVHTQGLTWDRAQTTIGAAEPDERGGIGPTMRSVARQTMNPVPESTAWSFVPGRDPASLQGCLDQLEQVLLQADARAAPAMDAAGARHWLEQFAAQVDSSSPHGTSLLADRLLTLVQALAQGVTRPTPAVLDTLHRAVDCLRALLAAGPQDAPEAELEGLLVEIQALTGGAAAPGTDDHNSQRGDGALSAPQPDTDAALRPAPADAAPRTEARTAEALQALLATLGPLVNAQAALVQALRQQIDPLPPLLERSAALVDDCLDAAARSLDAWRTARRPADAVGPELLEVVAVRASASICLVPASAVLECAAVPDGELARADDLATATPPLFDLSRWLEASQVDTPVPTRKIPPCAITVWTAAGERTWLADEVLFRRTVAVQPLETHFRAVPGVAGVAVLGEMGICLLLDTNAGPPAQGGGASMSSDEARAC